MRCWARSLQSKPPARCKVCDSEHAPQIAKRLKAGQAVGTIVTWLATVDFTVDRKTMYTHRDKHVFKVPEKAVVPVSTEPDAEWNSEAFLDSVIQFGHKNMVADPSTVTVQQALMAQKIKDARGQHDAQINLELTKLILAGSRPQKALPPPSIEGDFVEL